MSLYNSNFTVVMLCATDLALQHCSHTSDWGWVFVNHTPSRCANTPSMLPAHTHTTGARTIIWSSFIFRDPRLPWFSKVSFLVYFSETFALLLLFSVSLLGPSSSLNWFFCRAQAESNLRIGMCLSAHTCHTTCCNTNLLQTVSLCLV